MHTGTVADPFFAAYKNVGVVTKGYRYILTYKFLDFFLQFPKADIQFRLFGKAEEKAVADIGMLELQGKTVFPHHKFTEVLRRMDHAAYGLGLEHDFRDIPGFRAEDGRPGDDDLLPYADEEVGVYPEHGINEIEMFNHNPPSLFYRLDDRFRQSMPLDKSALKVEVKVIGMGAVKSGPGIVIVFIQYIQEREGPDIDAVIVISEFYARKHPFDDHAFPRTGAAYDSDEVVKRRQVLLGDAPAEAGHAVITPGREKNAVEMVLL
jgi:hypothetical protein